jgi:serine acetyltransferase
MSAAFALRRWVKERRHPLADAIYRTVLFTHDFSMPVIPGVHKALYAGMVSGRSMLFMAKRIFWWTPLFQSRLTKPATRLYLEAVPLVLGPVEITIGDHCHILGAVTITGRANGPAPPKFIMGKNCGIGWQTTLAVGRTIRLGDNVRISGRAFLAGYPGHPIDAKARAAGLPDTEDQIGDIVLEDDVWLGTGATVSAGVTIGRGTIVAAGSVVTKDLPPGVLAAGVPAKVIRKLAEESNAA